jgi:hypothetical protein
MLKADEARSHAQLHADKAHSSALIAYQRAVLTQTKQIKLDKGKS